MFENYLKNRKQFIPLEHNSTKNAAVTCSFPQGSILGRFKGTKCNHVCGRHKSFLLTHYINVLIGKMDKELTNVSNWFNANKLVLNVKKTSILFSANCQKKIIFCCGFRILILI